MAYVTIWGSNSQVTDDVTSPMERQGRDSNMLRAQYLKKAEDRVSVPKNHQ